MVIEWVNHAGFVVDDRDVRLVSDPWLDGTAFDDGWQLLSPTAVPDWSRITHLWFSHEHPDHFSPPNVRSIPAEARRSITVLYQTTHDKKVIKFCGGLGFRNVVEMPPSAWRPLAPDLEVMVTPYTAGDSWMAIRTPERTLLNLNDCVVRSASRAEEIRRLVGPVDVLCTQFSYANWVGNEEDVELRREQAREKLERVATQYDVLRPKSIIPFASFVWFCHEENYYLNDEINRIAPTVDFLRARTDAEIVVLYPGERWTVGAPHDTDASVARYEADYDTIPSRPRLKSRTVAMPELVAAATKFRERLLAENQPFVLRLMLKPTYVFLLDHALACELSVQRGLVESDLPRDRCDIAMGSESLLYALRNLWGGNTLEVNGRYRIPKAGHEDRFTRYARIASMNNRGEFANFAFLARRAWRKLRWIMRRPSPR